MLIVLCGCERAFLNFEQPRRNWRPQFCESRFIDINSSLFVCYFGIAASFFDHSSAGSVNLESIKSG